MSKSDPENPSEKEADHGLTDEPGELLFRWRDRAGRGAGLALVFFVGVALLVHAVGFYLFQVNAPISAREEARSAKVTMLDPNDAATAALLREVDDRLVFLRPASLDTGSRLRIEDFSVTFEPSFLQGRVEFQPPPGRSEKEHLLTELLPKDGLVLPPVAKVPADISPVGGLDEESGRAFEQVKRADLVVDFSTDGRLAVDRLPVGGSVADYASQWNLDQFPDFLQQQAQKQFVVVVMAKNTWSDAQRDERVIKLRDYFVACGYSRISVQQATGGSGRRILLDHRVEVKSAVAPSPASAPASVPAEAP